MNPKWLKILFYEHEYKILKKKNILPKKRFYAMKIAFFGPSNTPKFVSAKCFIIIYLDS